MQHNTYEFIEKVEELGDKYGLGVSKKTVGKSVAIVWKLKIDKARVDIRITSKRCTIIDDEGSSVSFEKSDSGWDKKSLEHIETLLAVYTSLGIN